MKRCMASCSPATKEPTTKRRELNFEKCSQCRRDKQKCLPTDRVWPQKCDRCTEKNYDCSSNHRTTEQQKPITSEQSDLTRRDDGSDAPETLHEIIIRWTWTNMVEETIAYQQDFENEFSEAMDIPHRGNPFLELEKSLQRERELILEKFEHLTVSDAKGSIAYPLIMGLLDPSFIKIPQIAHSQLFQDIDDSFFIMRMFKNQPRDMIPADLQKYSISYENVASKASSIFASLPTRPLDPVFYGPCLLPTFTKKALSTPLHRGPKDDLRCTEVFAKSHCYKAKLAFPNGTVNIQDYFGRSLLHIASFCGDVSAVRLALGLLFKRHTQDTEGFTCLHYACGRGNLDIARILLQDAAFHASEDALLSCRDNQGRTALITAASLGHREIVSLILGRPTAKDFINFGDNEECTALHSAVKRKHTGVVQELLQNHHVDINVQDFGGQTPIHLAILAEKDRESKEILQLLLDHKDSDLNTANIFKQNPLHLAIKNRHSEAICSLLDPLNTDLGAADDEGNTVLHLMAETGYVPKVQLSAYAEPSVINAQNIQGETALHLAVKYNKIGIAGYLLNFPDINLNMEAENGQTPLLYARRSKDQKMLDLLLETGKVSEESIRIVLDDLNENIPLGWVKALHRQLKYLEQCDV